MEEITIRPMTDADLDQVMTVEAASFPAPWSRDHFSNEIVSPHAFPLVALLEDGSAAGYICPTLVFDEGEILNVAVRSDLRGRGVGRLLLETAVSRLSAMGAVRVYLEVRPSNRVASSLYKSFGFVARGRRKAYYENGEDAILMEYDVKGRKEETHAV